MRAVACGFGRTVASEARRLVGEFVVTQKDLQTERTKPDVIGMGSYNSDSHNLQRFINSQKEEGLRASAACWRRDRCRPILLNAATLKTPTWVLSP